MPESALADTEMLGVPLNDQSVTYPPKPVAAPEQLQVTIHNGTKFPFAGLNISHILEVWESEAPISLVRNNAILGESEVVVAVSLGYGNCVSNTVPTV